MRILYVTDFHLRDPARSAGDKDHAENVLLWLSELASADPEADLLVIGGDIADAGEASAYDVLKAGIETLPFPVVPLVGNHDDRAICAQVLDLDGPFIQRRIDLGAFRFLFLDTLDPGKDSGLLCADRLDWIASEAAGAGERNVAIFMHHPPCLIGDPVLDPIRLSNPGDLAKALGAVRVSQIFFGHVHRTVVTEWNGIPATGLARPLEGLPTLSIDIQAKVLSSTLRGSHR